MSSVDGRPLDRPGSNVVVFIRGRSRQSPFGNSAKSVEKIKVMKVLVAEDDPVSRKFLEKILKSLGYEVTSCLDGAKAWAAFLETGYSIVISDWMMPEMDGLELCRRIRRSATWGYTYFIMQTAKTNKADFLDAMDAGADDYLTKPLDIEEVKVRLRVAERILDLHRAKSQSSAQGGLSF